ncbi:hypothetical protein SLA2020_442950 [Shorea laevis]
MQQATDISIESTPYEDMNKQEELQENTVEAANTDMERLACGMTSCVGKGKGRAYGKNGVGLQQGIKVSSGSTYKSAYTSIGVQEAEL